MIPRISLLLVVFCMLLTCAQGQRPSRNMTKEKVIWEQIQTIAPEALDDFKAATSAMDSGNYDEASRLYESVRQKAPDSDHVLRRLGICLASSGKISEGLTYLEKAVAKNASPENLISLSRYLSYPAEGKQGSTAQKDRALALAVQATQKLPANETDPEYQYLVAELALELDRAELFRGATEKLATQHPELMVSHYFSAILAATDEQWVTAENEILKAESLGLPHETVQAFLDSGVHTRAQVWHYAMYAGVLVGVWVAGLLLLFLFGKFMSKRTLRQIESTNPDEPTNRSELALRKWYRGLINVSGVYYFISIPVVMFLVLAVAASVTYGFWMLGRIPIKLVAILCIGAAITVYKMVRSLFLKVEKEDPGRSLNKDEAPGLWELTQRVAETVKTRPIDEIRITPGTEVAVYEKGSLRERSNDKARRILILGVGALNDFELNGFRAVLAHEYGHFSHRDTAGGDVALIVNDHMMKFAQAMIEGGQAVWWNIAFQFLRVYHFIFRRISHGATRLQEVLADRVSAAKYGAQAFEQGLTHVVRKGVEFHSLATREISESAASCRVLQNLYELKATDFQDIEQEAEQALNRATSEDDTHPSPVDRFRLTRKISTQSEPAISGKVWDLFINREALTREMTELVQTEMESSY